jgi:hypothetical protein
VPERARDSPVLLNAIFALSARHLGQTHHDNHLKKTYNELADTYNHRCIRITLNLLNSHEFQSGWTEHLFASAIILQVMEEMNGKYPVFSQSGFATSSRRLIFATAALHDDDNETVKEGHLPGMHEYVRERSFEPGTLGAASFWVGLRQEIYRAVTQRRQVRLRPGPRLADRSLDDTDDYTWANRAVVHCSDVINYCFGPERHQLSQWDKLDRWNGQWSEKRPPSYEPVFKEPADSAVFPEIWYHLGCQGRFGLAPGPSQSVLCRRANARLSHRRSTPPPRKALSVGAPYQIFQRGAVG